jgi:phospholipase C
MNIRTMVSLTLRGVRVGMVSLAALQLSVGPGLVAAATAVNNAGERTATPIKHVIVIIGENRSFDHVFATYVPKRGQTVHNLLSEGIIKLDANKNAIPGPNFKKAQQLSASDLGSQDTFLLSPPKQEFPNNQLPLPEVGGPSGADGYFTPSSAADTTVKCGTTTVNGKTTTNYLAPAACAALSENGLPDATDTNGLTYYQSLASGGTLQYSDTPVMLTVRIGPRYIIVRFSPRGGRRGVALLGSGRSPSGELRETFRCDRLAIAAGR